MSVILQQIVPWGRSLYEYQRMFALSDEELALTILGCGDGPASFNAEMTALKHKVTSIDPIYQFSAAQIEQRVKDTYEVIVAQVEATKEDYLWDYFCNVHHLAEHRLASMKQFLLDFEAGKSCNRYLPESLPNLSFADGQFDLALCSHLLFLYSEQLSFEFHRDSIAELCRVAKEVRIFPLLALDCKLSPHVEPLQNHFSAQEYKVEILKVGYEFQKGGNQMMKISR